MEELKKELIRKFEQYLGYPEGLWWGTEDYEWKIGIEEPTRVTYKENLLGETEAGNEEKHKNRQLLQKKEKTNMSYRTTLDIDHKKPKPLKQDQKIEKYF